MPNVIAYGDSLTRDDSIEHRHKWCGVRTSPEIDCEPRGVSGEKTADGVARLLADLDAGLVDADYVVLGWATNDMKSSQWDVDALILEPIETAVNAVLDAGMEPILWAPGFQYLNQHNPTTPATIANVRNEFELRPGLESLAEVYGLRTLDLWETFGTYPGPDVYDDHVHLTPLGNDILADVAVPEPDIGMSILAAVLALVALICWREKR